MRALLVVIVAPVREEHSRFAERVYQLAVQALLPEAAIEALCVPVLPRASGVDVEGLDPVFFEPSIDRLGDELGAVARARAFGGSMLAYRLLQQGQHVASLDGVDAVALPGELVDQIEASADDSPDWLAHSALIVSQGIAMLQIPFYNLA